MEVTIHGDSVFLENCWVYIMTAETPLSLQARNTSQEAFSLLSVTMDGSSGNLAALLVTNNLLSVAMILVVA